MRWRSWRVAGGLILLAVVLPVGGTALVVAGTAAGAVTCDGYAAGTTSVPSGVTVSPMPIAPAGSLAAGATVPVTFTVTDSAGNCVSGGPTWLFFSGPGTADPATSDRCLNTAATLTANWTQCTTDGSGTITVTYGTVSPAAVWPNGGTSDLEATTQMTGVLPTPQATTTYTYASVSVTAQNISATEGSVFSGRVGQMTCSNCAYTAQATIDWGDGSSSTGSVTQSPADPAVFDIGGSHTYGEENLSGYSVAVRGFAANAPSVTSIATATVADAALTATGTSLSGHTRHPVSGAVAAFSDSDPAGTVSDYSATIAWGDGTSSQGTIATSGSNFVVDGSHTYKHRGIFTVSTTIADVGGANRTAQSVESIH